MRLILVVSLIRIVTLLVHHLPRRLQSTISYLLLSIKLLGLPHRRLLLLLHLQHLLLILQIYIASLHLECI